MTRKQISYPNSISYIGPCISYHIHETSKWVLEWNVAFVNNNRSNIEEVKTQNIRLQKENIFVVCSTIRNDGEIEDDRTHRIKVRGASAFCWRPTNLNANLTK